MKRRVETLIRTVNVLKPPELTFQKHVKRSLRYTNFILIGEELLIKHPRVGQCDLLLANTDTNFLVSLELKVGKRGDNGKFSKLREQVNTYTEAMSLIFPEYGVYGIGAYKIRSKSEIMWIDEGNTPDLKSIRDLKLAITEGV